ncbi:MAG TPA: hypothetical protein VGN00_05415 [Puia sp.]|jgi:hypothetical protein
MKTRDPRYETIKPLFDQGEITVFRDIFTFVPLRILAKDLGKKTKRLTELVEHVEELKVEEIVLIGSFCKFTLKEMFSLLEPVYPPAPENTLEKNDLQKYQIVRVVFDEKKINFLEDIFSYIPRSSVAADLGKNRSGFTKKIRTQIKKIPLKDLVLIGRYCNLSLAETFALVEAEYQRQNAKNLPKGSK